MISAVYCWEIMRPSIRSNLNIVADQPTLLHGNGAFFQQNNDKLYTLFEEHNEEFKVLPCPLQIL